MQCISTQHCITCRSSASLDGTEQTRHAVEAGNQLKAGRRFMAELGQVVPILPIVTKSDSMTIREAATYRREVYRKLQNPQLPEPQGDPLGLAPPCNGHDVLKVTILLLLFLAGVAPPC